MLKQRVHFLCLTTALALILVVLPNNFEFSTIRAFAHPQLETEDPSYSCGDPNNYHCNGTVGWGGGTVGAASTIDIRPLSHTCCSGNFIANKIWYAGGPLNSFVEAGYRTRVVSDLDVVDARVVTEYFWADQRPAYQIYWYHPIQTVAYGDYGRQSYFTIMKNLSYPDRVIVDIETPNYRYYEISTDNTMYADVIIVGTQLSGTSGASMNSETHFKENYWRESNGRWHRQVQNGGLSTNYGPIHRAWQTPPSVLPGGDFFTRCC